MQFNLLVRHILTGRIVLLQSTAPEKYASKEGRDYKLTCRLDKILPSSPHALLGGHKTPITPSQAFCWSWFDSQSKVIDERHYHVRLPHIVYVLCCRLTNAKFRPILRLIVNTCKNPLKAITRFLR